RAYRISPVRSAIERGITYTLHQDTPVVPPNMPFTLWTAVNRKTRTGEVIGPDQRISILEALKGVTINAAYQYFEEDSKGSITVGKRADLVILDKNPMNVDPDDLKDLKVLETIKDGKTIYKT
ncbi:MAG: amidohydrolase family protein, partial [Spirochaetaceae bacterium]|nr:amidohydrolase family protein [Spirochaetaceae bacterium]